MAAMCKVLVTFNLWIEIVRGRNEQRSGGVRMGFIQCKDENEVEAVLQKKKHGFVTEDFRVYDKINFGDDEIYLQMDSGTINALENFQSYLQMINDGRHEMPFTQILNDAKELDKSFKAAMKAIKFKPLRKLK